MKLYVMRHGPAEDEAPDGLDHSRALTVSGRERVRWVAKKLGELGEAPRFVVASPLVRALQTAEVVHTTLGLESAVEAHTALAPGGAGSAFVLAMQKAGKKRLMVVGHEPDVSILCARLLGNPLPHGFLKGMVVSLRVDVDVAGSAPTVGLRFVLDPKTLELLADHRGVRTPAPRSSRGA